MCKLIIAVKKAGQNDALERCIYSQYGDIYGERDGFGAMVLGKSTKTYLALEREKYGRAFTDALNALEKSRLAFIHSRTATTGAVTEENIHVAREYNGRVMAQNGTVGKFSKWFTGKKKDEPVQTYGSLGITRNEERAMSKKQLKKALRRCEWTINNCPAPDCSLSYPCGSHINTAIEYDWCQEQLKAKAESANENTATTSNPWALFKTEKEKQDDDTDTFQFLKALPETLTVSSLTEAIKEYEFNGVAGLYDKTTGKTWLMTTRQVDVHTDGREWLAIYSFTPDKPYKTVSVAGLDLYEDDESIKKYKLDAGVYELEV